ncbi:hypothetical protein SASPL_115130 [Salvia splendens]|uniref:LRR receptor-like serine/threonine-protein kinase FLS2 n=1 Tax=Salvia splendens TaxID=180675 RepID=A0A8X8Y1V8_SALSN|nr:hypothetical protein SASPL_115130 [Salvia splendens]
MVTRRTLSPELLRSKRVIETFRKTIGADPKGVTDTWNGDICYDKSKYKGFICDTTIKEQKLLVALVNFNNYEFQGKRNQPLALRNFLENLTEIIAFHSNSNFFSGGIPLGLDQIRSLFELDLSNNNLTGPFPKEVLVATNLTFLDLRFNHLSGYLNPNVFDLDLNILFLNNNNFIGPIPPALGRTPALYVTLANNKFSGPIPSTIGDTKNTLLEILLLGNYLTGTLPYEIGFLEKATLFDASANKITGQIPHSFGCLKSINYLNMSMNQLCGPVPEPLCRLPELVNLTLSDNYITQVGPACRKLIEKKVLDVGRNCILDLPNQKSKEMCAGFFHKQPCREPANLNKIPCRFESGNEPKPVVERKLTEKPRSYAALELQG